ncbi:MAG: DNA polymerase IV [Candidatus Hydrogenedentes bacterium]|nr:DNA polymerase IV [Candidatus Hydrogenedentota bacterium]
MTKRILHIDMDAFFASVEMARNPLLKGKPLIVGGNEDDLRSVVASASYEARKFGVHSAMPIVQAKRLCPNGIFMRCSQGIYNEVCHRIQIILETATPVIQMASIDEANLDITGSIHLFGDEEKLARHLKKSIFEQEHISCTIGVASNKMVAKIAANESKPDGYLSIPNGHERLFLAPLAVGKLPGVGPHTQDALESLGVLTIKQLAEVPEQILKSKFGEQGILSLQYAALGVGSDEITRRGAPKSISRETTFLEDIADWLAIEPVIFRLSEHCAHTLRSEGLETKRITLKVRYSDFSTKSFSKTVDDPTALDVDIIAVLKELFFKAKVRRARVRLVGVNLSKLSYNQHQLRLFNREKTEKWERLYEAVDIMRGKMGFDAVHVGKTLEGRVKKDRSDS